MSGIDLAILRTHGKAYIIWPFFTQTVFLATLYHNGYLPTLLLCVSDIDCASKNYLKY